MLGAKENSDPRNLYLYYTINYLFCQLIPGNINSSCQNRQMFAFPSTILSASGTRSIANLRVVIIKVGRSRDFRTSPKNTNRAEDGGGSVRKNAEEGGRSLLNKHVGEQRVSHRRKASMRGRQDREGHEYRSGHCRCQPTTTSGEVKRNLPKQKGVPFAIAIIPCLRR